MHDYNEIENEVFEFKCSTGLLFDIVRQICDFKAKVDNCDVNTGKSPFPPEYNLKIEDSFLYFEKKKMSRQRPHCRNRCSILRNRFARSTSWPAPTERVWTATCFVTVTPIVLTAATKDGAVSLIKKMTDSFGNVLDFYTSTHRCGEWSERGHAMRLRQLHVT